MLPSNSEIKQSAKHQNQLSESNDLNRSQKKALEESAEKISILSEKMALMDSSYKKEMEALQAEYTYKLDSLNQTSTKEVEELKSRLASKSDESKNFETNYHDINTKLAAINEKLSAEIKRNKSLELMVSRIPVLEDHLIEFPALKDKVQHQLKTIESNASQLSTQSTLIAKHKVIELDLKAKIDEITKTNKDLTNKLNTNLSENDESYLDMYSEAKNETDKCKTLIIEQKTTIEEQRKLIEKLTKSK